MRREISTTLPWSSSRYVVGCGICRGKYVRNCTTLVSQEDRSNFDFFFLGAIMPIRIYFLDVSVVLGIFLCPITAPCATLTCIIKLVDDMIEVSTFLGRTRSLQDG